MGDRSKDVKTAEGLVTVTMEGESSIARIVVVSHCAFTAREKPVV
jgi:DNA-binding protein YbaB